MTGLMRKKQPNTSWLYPDSAEVLEAASLYIVQKYIEVRRNTVFKVVSQRPIYGFCKEVGQQRGAGSHLFWWEQEMEPE